MKKALISVGFFWASQLAALTCSTPITISETAGYKSSCITINEKGEAALMWENPTFGGRIGLSWSLRSAEKEWSSPDLIDHVANEGSDQFKTNILLDEEGRLYALYNGVKGSKDQDLYFARKMKGFPGSSLNLYTSSDGSKHAPNPFLDPQGNVFLIPRMVNASCSSWFFSQEKSWMISYNPRTEKKTTSTRCFDPYYSGVVFLTASFNPQGDGIVLWTGFKDSSLFWSSLHFVLDGIWFRDGKTVSEPLKICNLKIEDLHYDFDVSANNSRAIAAIWKKSNDKLLTIQAIVSPSDPVDLFAYESPALGMLALALYKPKIAIDQDGNVLAAWTIMLSNRSSQVFAAYKPTGQPWSDPVPLSEPMNFNYTLALTRAGPEHFVVVWDESGAIHGAALSTMTQTWSSALLSPSGVAAWRPSVAFNSKGQGIVSWTFTAGGKSYVQFADLSLD